MNQQNNYTTSVLIVGKKSIGKTSLINYFYKSENETPTKKKIAWRDIEFFDNNYISVYDSGGYVDIDSGYEQEIIKFIKENTVMVWYAVDASKGIGGFDIKLINAILRVQSPVCIILTKADLVDGKKLKEDIEEIKQHFMFLEVFAASAKEDSAACKQFSLQNLIRTTRALFPEVEKSKDKLENSMGENDEEARNKIIKIAIAAAAVVIILYWIFK